MHRSYFYIMDVGVATLPQRGGCRCMSYSVHIYTCSLYILSRALHNVLGTSVTQVSSVAVHGDLIKIHERASLRLCLFRPVVPTLRIFRGVSQWSYLETIYRLSACSRLSYYETENNINCFQPLLCRAIPVDTCVSTDHQPVLPYNVRFNT